MLYRKSGAEFSPWSVGAAEFVTEAADRRSCVAVRWAREAWSSRNSRCLTRGAEWSMVSREVAETIPEAFGAAVGEQVAYRTARGPVTGTPRRVPITILADHGRGSSVTVSSTVSSERVRVVGAADRIGVHWSSGATEDCHRSRGGSPGCAACLLRPRRRGLNRTSGQAPHRMSESNASGDRP